MLVVPLGVHAEWLEGDGHQVELVDLVPGPRRGRPCPRHHPRTRATARDLPLDDDVDRW